MSATPTPTPASQSLLGIDWPTFIAIIIVAVIALVLERLIATYFSRAAKRLKLEPHVTNNLVLTSRILILFFAVAAIASIGRLLSEWVISLSAIGGTALGFASQKTIGNFVAGLFLLASKPFRVGDYVRIGAVEGIVMEITINYAKILTTANNTVSVSNLQILDRDITNFASECGRNGIHCYTFEVGFDHTVSAKKIGEIFDAVFKRYAMEFPKNPSYTLIRSSGTERVYLVYLYVRKPEEIFTFRPKIAEEVFTLWDMERTKQGSHEKQPALIAVTD